MLALLFAVVLPSTAGLANHTAPSRPPTSGLANHTAVNRTHIATHHASNATAAGSLLVHRQKPLLCHLPLAIRGCGANERDGLAMWQALLIVCAALCGSLGPSSGTLMN